MHPAKDKRRTKPACARWRHWQAVAGGARAVRVPGPGSSGINQPTIGRVVREQQRAEPWPRTLRIGPADDDKFLAVRDEAFQVPRRKPSDGTRGLWPIW